MLQPGANGQGDAMRLNWAWCLAGIALGAVSPAGAQTLRDDTIAAITAAQPTATVTVVDPLTIKVKTPGGGDLQINFDRIEAFCAASPGEDCVAERERFIAGVAELVTTKPDEKIVASQLRIVIRSDDYAKEVARVGTGKEIADPPLAMPFAEGLTLMLAADYPNTLKILDQSAVRDLGLDRDALLALATRQVLADLPRIPSAEEVEGKLRNVAGFDYGASILLQPDRWRPLALATGGRLFVAVPSDNDVLIGTVESGPDLRALEKLVAQSYAAAGRGISPHIYRWSPTGWEVAK